MRAKELLTYLDLTTLGVLDRISDVKTVADRVLENGCAAVCVYPRFISILKGEPKLSKVTVATVCAFPHGQTTPKNKINEAGALIDMGADEIDMVAAIGAIGEKTGEENWDALFEEVRGVKDVCGERVLKVILETSVLEGMANGSELIRHAARVSCEAGCDFLKTSTGKEPGGASIASVTLLCEEARKYYAATGRRVGIKPSGGIKKVKDAIAFAEIVKDVAGDEWMTPKHFRLGASSLLDAILEQKYDDHI